MRIEPPPSEPIANGETPQATEAPEPAEEPPGVSARFQGLRVSHAELGAKLGEQAQDHGLDRDVEGRGRLVEDQEPGLDHDGARDADPGALAAESWCG